MKDETKLVHSGRDPSAHHGTVNVPVYHASTILAPTLDEHQSRTRKTMYGREGTPTVFALEELVCALEKASEAIICGSGLGAISTIILGLCQSGDHILASDNAYQPVKNLLDNVLARFGVSVDYFDPTDLATMESMIKPETRLIWLESPGTHTFEVTDIPAAVAIAKARNIQTVVDNTWSGGVYLKPLTMGVDVSVQAATKYIGGHSDIMMGVIACNEATAGPIRKTFDYLGNAAGPDDIFLATRGIRTLSVRLERHYKNGMIVAEWLQKQPQVVRVMHPALPDFPTHDIWKRDFTGASGLFGLIVDCPSRTALAAMLDNMQYFGMGFSWGGFESLLIPYSPQKNRSVMTADPGGQHLRIHIGLEDPDDLIADLAAGFERMNKHDPD